MGLCAWILERRRSWGDCRGDVERRFTKDHLLTTMNLYWLTDSFVSAVRYYQEAAVQQWKPSHDRMPAVGVPTGLSQTSEQQQLRARRVGGAGRRVHLA